MTRLRELRKKHGYTQDFVAEAINVPRITYVRYENNTRNIKIPVLLALADLYHVSIDFLLDHNDDSAHTPGFTIRTLREKKHLSQKQLGEIIGVTQQSVGAWESGLAQPNTQNLMALSNLFHVSIDNIMGVTQIFPDDCTAASDDEMRSWIINRILSLPQQDLLQVSGFLAGLAYAKSIPSIEHDTHEPIVSSNL